MKGANTKQSTSGQTVEKSDNKNALVIIEIIEEQIFMIRGLKVMVDFDLARLYGVSTKALNQAVKRNIRRFPPDFMFELSEDEKNELVTNCDRLKYLKHSSKPPNAFTEHGAAMLSSILKSEKAIQVNIAIMRTFAKLRNIVATHKELAQRLNELEMKFGRHEQEIIAIFEMIRKLIKEEEKPKNRIGFL